MDAADKLGGLAGRKDSPVGIPSSLLPLPKPLITCMRNVARLGTSSGACKEGSMQRHVTFLPHSLAHTTALSQAAAFSLVSGRGHHSKQESDAGTHLTRHPRPNPRHIWLVVHGSVVNQMQGPFTMCKNFATFTSGISEISPSSAKKKN
jgi:hypothetical protein